MSLEGIKKTSVGGVDACESECFSQSGIDETKGKKTAGPVKPLLNSGEGILKYCIHLRIKAQFNGFPLIFWK